MTKLEAIHALSAALATYMQLDEERAVRFGGLDLPARYTAAKKAVDAALAAVDQDADEVKKPRASSSAAKAKNEVPSGWGPAAWEYYQACRGAKTYAAFNPETLARRAQAALDKKEDILPPVAFSAYFYSPSGRDHCYAEEEGAKNDAAVALVKLGAPGERITFGRPPITLVRKG